MQHVAYWQDLVLHTGMQVVASSNCAVITLQ